MAAEATWSRAYKEVMDDNDSGNLGSISSGTVLSTLYRVSDSSLSITSGIDMYYHHGVTEEKTESWRRSGEV